MRRRRPPRARASRPRSCGKPCASSPLRNPIATTPTTASSNMPTRCRSTARCVYALTGNLDRRGGNMRFLKPAVNDVEGRKLLSQEQFNKRLGYAERPLGPTNTGKVQAYEGYKTILTGKAYPVRGFLSFRGDS